MKKYSRGFTLIELLVVIAIIGILSSVVLASLTSARAKGTDVAIKAELAQMKAQAELFASSNGDSYGDNATDGACGEGMFDTGTNNLSALVAGITDKDGSPVCNSEGTAWAVSATLSDATTWCVDNDGAGAAGVAQATGICS